MNRDISPSFVPSIPPTSPSVLLSLRQRRPMDDAINLRPQQSSRRPVYNANNSIHAAGTSAREFEIQRPVGRHSSTCANGEYQPQDPQNRVHPYDLLFEERRLDVVESRRPPRVVILVGLQGSGKSTFARRLLALQPNITKVPSEIDSSSSSFFSPRPWHRISQDELGDRKRCESACISRLQAGGNVVVDRCNFDTTQRSHWVNIARARGAHVGAVVFAVPLEECISRVQRREHHETLVPGDDVPGIVRNTARQFRPPSVREKLDWCRHVRNEDDVARVLDEILQVHE